eukprot:scaffold4871_cov116-Skeletonema_marinoi.AAC.7
MSKQSSQSQSSHEDSDPAIFAWPQTTLTCVSRRNPLHASSSSVFSKIGGVSLRYSPESKSYVIDGRMKTGEDTKSKARSTIRSHYRWVRQDISLPPNNIEADSDANNAAEPVQQARKEDNTTKWNHTRIKKLRKFAAERRTQIISTPNLTVKESTSPAISSHENSANEPTTLVECSEKKKARAWLDIDIDNALSANKTIAEDEPTDEEEDHIPTSTSLTFTSKDSYSEESSTSYIPPPPPSPSSSQPQLQQSFSDESSLTDNSPTCIATDVYHYERPDTKAFARMCKISTKGIINKNERKRGRVTWWDDRHNQHKPLLLKTDAPMDDDAASLDLMGRYTIGQPSDSDSNRKKEEFSFDLNDNDTFDTSSYGCKASKYFTGEFWMDKNEKLKMQGGKVRKKVDDLIVKVKMMAVDLSESVGEVSCGMDKKEMSEHMHFNSSGIHRVNAGELKRDERRVHQEVMHVPITEVIIKGTGRKVFSC